MPRVLLPCTCKKFNAMSDRGPHAASPLAVRMKPLPFKARGNRVAPGLEQTAPTLPEEKFGAESPVPSPTLNSSPLLSAANEHGRSSATPPPPAAADPSSLDDARALPGTGSDGAPSHRKHAIPVGLSRDTRSLGELKCESGDGSLARPLKGPMQLPLFLCKISAKHLPQLDVFSSSDPVCFVRDVSGAWPRIIRKSYNNPIPPPIAAPPPAVRSNHPVTPRPADRTEVVPDNPDPEFDQHIFFQPLVAAPPPAVRYSAPSEDQVLSGEDDSNTPDNGTFLYETHHVLEFALYDSCRKDALVASSALQTHSDLDLMGSATVKVQLLLQLLAAHDSDPRANLTLKIELARDKDVSVLTKTSELLGRGVNMIKDLSLFSIESKSKPLLVLNLVPIRCDCARMCSARQSPIDSFFQGGQLARAIFLAA
jgi:hypothetical protein